MRFRVAEFWGFSLGSLGFRNCEFWGLGFRNCDLGSSLGSLGFRVSRCKVRFREFGVLDCVFGFQCLLASYGALDISIQVVGLRVQGYRFHGLARGSNMP